MSEPDAAEPTSPDTAEPALDTPPPPPIWEAFKTPRAPLFLVAALGPSLLAGLLVLSGAPDRVWARLGGADRYEANDTIADAFLIKRADTIQASCPRGDVDYYAIDVPAGKALRVSTHPGPEQHGATSIHDAAGIQLATSRQGFWTEQATHVPEQPGRHLIRVWGARGDYTLDVEFVSPRRRFEPNGSRNEAAPIPLGTHRGLLCDGEDWYRVSIPAHRELVARVDGEVAQLGLELIDGAQVAALGSATTLTHEARGQLAPAPREVLLRVAGAQAGYDLDLALSTPDPAALAARRLRVIPGAFEPNNSEAAAPRLEPGVYPDLEFDGADHYLIDVPDPDTTLRVTVAFDPRVEQFTLNRSDPYTHVVTSSSQGDPGVRSVECYLPQGGNQYVSVHTQQDTAYTMTVELLAGPPGERLLPGDYTIQGTGDDNWLIDARAGEVIDVRLKFDGGRGDIDMTLSDASMQVASSTGVTSTEHLSYLSAIDQPLFLRVYGPTMRYALSLGVGGGNASAPATSSGGDEAILELTRGEHALQVTGNRTFEIALEAGQRLDVLLRNRDRREWISGDIQDLDGVSVTTNESQTEDANGRRVQLTHQAEASGPVRLVVWASSMSGSTSSLEAEVRVDGRLLPDPVTITPGRHGALQCPGQVVYELALGGGQRLVARAEFVHADGDIDLSLQDEAGNELAASATTEDHEQVAFEAPLDMTVQIRVYNAPNVFDLDLEVTGPD